jgi:hypothetical protein
MMAGEAIRGQCLCGAVQIRVGDPPGWVGVCHCDMCKRWSGAVFASFPATDVTLSGPVAEFRSSALGVRAFCQACGSHLYMRDEGRAERDLMPGLFDATRDWVLKSEIYTDRAMHWALMPGTHRRATKAEYEARNPLPQGEPT